MSFKELSECTLLYVCVAVGIALVILATVYYLIVCYRHCVKCGVAKSTISTVIKSSATFSVVPSIAIVTGLVSLAAVIGIPYGWFRLSVIGSVAYELMAANMALTALNLDIATADGYTFGLMMWAMCIPITITVIFNLFLVKKIHLGTLKLGVKDARWGALSQTVFMTTLLVSLTIPLIGSGWVSLLTFITSAVIAIVVSVISSKGVAWLGNFTLVFSLIGAMASSVLWNSLFA